MSFQVNQNFNPYNKQQAMGMNSSSSPETPVAMGVNTPQLQNMNVDNAIDNSALKGLKDKEDDTMFSKKTFLLSLPVTAGMVYGMDKFNVACKGTGYDASLVGKINNFGETLGKKLPFIDNTFKKLGNITTWINTKIISKNSITSAFINNPSIPESHMANMMAVGTHAEIASEALGKLKRYIDIGGELAPGSTTKERIEQLAKESMNIDNIKEIMKICEAQGDRALRDTKFWNIREIPLLGGLLPEYHLSELIPENIRMHKLLNRDIHFAEFSNKIKSIVDPKGATTIGRNLSKYSLRMLEGLTNGTAGGKFAMFMGAYFIADAIKKTINAPNKKGEKRKVFAENMISNVGMYLTMPASIVLMHKFGGLQYLGMGKGEKLTENLAKYRDELVKLNAAVDADTIDKATHKAKVKELKDIRFSALRFQPGDSFGQKALKVVKNIIYRPIMKAFDIATVGLERIKPFTKDSNAFMKFIKEAGYKLKGGAGYPMRFGLFMFAIAPFFTKILAKGSHLFFGRPEKSILDEGKEKPKEKEHPPLIYPDYAAPSAKSATEAMQAVNKNSGLDYNAVQTKKAGMIPAEEPEKRRYIPSDENVIARQQHNLVNMYSAPQREMISDAKPSNKPHDKYNYVPSDSGVRQKYDDSAELEKYRKQIEKSDNAIKLASKYSGHKDKD